MTQVGDRVKVPVSALQRISSAMGVARSAQIRAQEIVDQTVLALGLSFSEDYDIRLDEKAQEFVVEAKT